MKIKHISLLVLSTAGFLASCGNNINEDQKFLDTINSVVNEHKDEISTCYDAVDYVNEAGYDIEGHQLEKDSYCFAYDWAGKKFVIMEGDSIVRSPKNYKRNDDTYNYFKFTSHYDASSIYSQYLTKDFEGADMLVVTTGLDMGSNWNVKSLIYNNTSTIAKNIYLNTFSDYLTITAPIDNITHYGDANNVFVVSMGEDKEFHAYGTYAYIQPYMGNIYLESSSVTDLFELKENSKAKIHYVDGAEIEATINAPELPTKFDLDYIAVNDYTDIIDNDKESKKKTNFFRLESDVAFPTGASETANAWFVKNNFFLDLNGHKISFTGNATSIYTADGNDKYHAGIVIDSRPIEKGGVDKDLECYIVDTQPTLYERPSIELNDCSIIVSGSKDHSALLNITSGRIDDIRGVAEDFNPSTKPSGWVNYNNPAILVIGNTQDRTEAKRDLYKCSFDMYGGYIRSKIGPKLQTLLATQPYWAFKCIQPRGEGATVNMSYGDLYSHSYCISGQGNPNDKYGGTTVNISGGTMVGGLGHYPSDKEDVKDVYTPLFFPQDGSLTITGGNITGPTCLDAKTGTIKINGGIFTATRDYDYQESTTSGSTADGSVLLLESNYNTYSTKGIFVEVNDAVMTSKHGYITNIIGEEGHFKDVNVTHTGGTYHYAQETGTHINDNVKKASITVSGGTWIKGE